MPENYTTHLQHLLDRWQDGDDSAIDEIIEHSQSQLRRMTSKMLKQKPHVGRWNQTDDVLQNALVRLFRALKSVKPDSKRAYVGLAATQIRRELIDMARSLYGPLGQGRNHHTEMGKNASQDVAPLYEGVDQVTSQEGQMEMTEFHESVDKLDAELREVFELTFYQGLTRTEVAKLVGVSERTVKRRWRDARLAIQEAVQD